MEEEKRKLDEEKKEISRKRQEERRIQESRKRSRSKSLDSDKIKRKETKDTSDDLELCILERLKKHFPLANHGLDDIKYFYIDSLYSKEDAKELEMFNNETERLYDVLRTNSPARSFAHQKDFMRLHIYRDFNSNLDNSENDKSQ